jgi:hypothetical protein
MTGRQLPSFAFIRGALRALAFCLFLSHAGIEGATVCAVGGKELKRKARKAPRMNANGGRMDIEIRSVRRHPWTCSKDDAGNRIRPMKFRRLPGPGRAH